MTDMKQPEALRLAQFCRAIARGLLIKPYIEDLNAAAALLAHQHAEITELRTKLEELEKQEPFGYVNTNTGQFFAYVESCRKNNEGHWRTVYTIPQPAPAAQVDVKDAAQLYPVVIDGLLWLCTKRGGTFKPVDDCAAVNPPLSWKNALAADKREQP